MANYTTNYNLEMPEQNDFYNVDVQNENMKKIDQAIKEAGNNEVLEGNVAGLVEKIGTTTDVGGSNTAGSVMGKLNTVINQNAREVSLTGEGATVYENEPEHTVTATFEVLAKFIAPVTGLYKITGVVSNPGTNFVQLRVGKPIANNVTFKATEDSTTYFNNASMSYPATVVGAKYYLPKTYGKSITSTTDQAEILKNSDLVFYTDLLKGASKNMESLFYCYAGERVILWICDVTETAFVTSNIKITYQPREV